MKYIQLKKDSLSDILMYSACSSDNDWPSILVLNFGKKFCLSERNWLQKSVRKPSETELLNLRGSAQHHTVQLLQK